MPEESMPDAEESEEDVRGRVNHPAEGDYQ
jgi:hypothetical protein